MNRNLAACCKKELVDPAVAICGKLIHYTDPFLGERWFLSPFCARTKDIFTWDQLKGLLSICHNFFSFKKYFRFPGINIDLVILAIDIGLMLLVLIILEVGVLNMIAKLFNLGKAAKVGTVKNLSIVILIKYPIDRISNLHWTTMFRLSRTKPGPSSAESVTSLTRFSSPRI